MKKKKNWKIGLIVGIGAFSCASSCAFVGVLLNFVGVLLNFAVLFYYLFDPFHRSNLVAKYSDDNNYQKYTGIITSTEHVVEYSYFLYFDELLAEDGQTYSKPKDKKSGLRLSIFANNRELVWERLQPEVGLEISFIGPLYPTSMGVKPIVQITARGEEILSYEEGKAAVVEWAKKQW